MKNVRKKRHFPFFKIFFSFALIGILIISALVYFFPIKHSNIINKYAKKYNLRPEFIYAIINTESGFDEKEVSPKGAKGLMQIMKDTADWASSQETIDNYTENNIFLPDVNIHIGCWYISWLSERYNGDEKLILAAYNAGGGNVTKWLADMKYSKDGKTLSKIPFPETENYVKKVTSNEKVYKYILKLPFFK